MEGGIYRQKADGTLEKLPSGTDTAPTPEPVPASAPTPQPVPVPQNKTGA